MEVVWGWLRDWLEVIGPTAKLDGWAQYGQVGDYIGGVFGTLLALASLIALLLTLRINREAMARQGIHSVFAVMSKTHDDLVASFRVAGFEGAEAFRILLSDYNRCMRLTVQHYPELSVRETIDVAYTAFFYGPTITGRKSISDKYDAEKITRIFDDISLLRDKLRARYPNLKNHRLNGNQSRLSNYYRNMYAIYNFIDEGSLPLKERKSILKTIRTKMSNHEQALLALNICSHLGASWERQDLIDRYEPIKNIPHAFLNLPQGQTIDNLFPEVRFEFEDRMDNKNRIFCIELLGFSMAIKIRQRAWRYFFKKLASENGRSWSFWKL